MTTLTTGALETVAMNTMIAMNTLVVMEIFHLLYIRNLHNIHLSIEVMKGTKALWIAVGIIVAAQIAITYLSPMQRVFETRAIEGLDALLILGAGVTLFALVETEKQIRIRFFPYLSSTAQRRKRD